MRNSDFVSERILHLCLISNITRIKQRNQESLVGVTTRFLLDGSGFEPRWRHEIFSSPRPSRRALGPPQPPVQSFTVR